MATKKTKTLAAVTTVTSMNTSQYIPLSDGSGNVTKITLANLKASLLGGLNLNAMNDGVFIMFHRRSDDYPLAVKPDKWASYQNSGEIAEGVMVVEGGKILVVAPTEATLYWSSAAVSAGGKTTTDRETALNDWTGKTSTAAQITHNECKTESYAPGFCASYERVNANGQGLTAGKWWLPSLGELMMIYANMRKINYALSLINGATQLAETWYWSSTEYSATHAWRLGLTNGNAYYFTKATHQTRVRPVSAFLR
ncbi:hypothetical protein H6B32_05440 [Bacteroides gallinaceum]|uniref:Lcl domain-containing protein n=1 Tax=Bacteroides gallinaceum TaxID=1462571 RepID=UPI00195627C2|nr:DUF1566 domain-containing protein [Bacteroides gallinaceum]MBM6944629.1 hypothetical protein [Bacteroides gallinaceum]